MLRKVVIRPSGHPIVVDPEVMTPVVHPGEV